MMTTPVPKSNIALVYIRIDNGAGEVSGVDGKRNEHRPTRTRNVLILKNDRNIEDAIIPRVCSRLLE